MYIGIILLAGTVAAALLMLIGWALGRYSRAPEIARARTIANSELAGRRSNLVGHWARIGVVGVLRVRLARWSNYLARIIKRLL